MKLACKIRLSELDVALNHHVYQKCNCEELKLWMEM